MYFEIEAREEQSKTVIYFDIRDWPVEGWEILLSWMYYEKVNVICSRK